MGYDMKGDDLPPQLANCVQQAVTSTFETIYGDKPAFLTDGVERKVGDGVVGIISFVGDITWLMMVAIPKSFAGKMARDFVGFDVDYNSPDMGDVAGELANVIAGDVVARLSEDGIKVAMSLPTIMRGCDVEPLLPSGIPARKLHFSMGDGTFMLKVAGSKPGEAIGRKPGS